MEPCDQHQSVKSTSTRHSVSHTSLAISSRPQVIRPSCTEHAMLGDNSSECSQVTKLREQVLHARGPRLSALSASCADLASLWTQLRHRECTRATSGISNKHRNQRRNLPRHVGKLACRVHSTPQINVIGPLSRTTEEAALASASFYGVERVVVSLFAKKLGPLIVFTLSHVNHHLLLYTTPSCPAESVGQQSKHIAVESAMRQLWLKETASAKKDRARSRALRLLGPIAGINLMGLELPEFTTGGKDPSWLSSKEEGSGWSSNPSSSASASSSAPRL